MDDTTRDKLLRLQELHEQRTRIQREEDALAAELAASGVRGVRTALAQILGLSLEALRLRYGTVQSATAAVHAASPTTTRSTT